METPPVSGRPCCFNQLGPYFLEQVTPILGWEGLDQLLFCRRQHAVKPDHEEIAEAVIASWDVLQE